MTKKKKSVIEAPAVANAPIISDAAARALADSLAKVAEYVPTQYVDWSQPDIDAEHLNHAENAIKMVTDLANGSVDVIKDLQTQLTVAKNELSRLNSEMEGRGISKKRIFTKFSEIPAENAFLSATVSGAGIDPDSPVPNTSATTYWWNVLQSSDGRRLTQIANNPFIHHGRLFFRVMHDGIWYGWWECFTNEIKSYDPVSVAEGANVPFIRLVGQRGFIKTGFIIPEGTAAEEGTTFDICQIPGEIAPAADQVVMHTDSQRLFAFIIYASGAIKLRLFNGANTIKPGMEIGRLLCWDPK